MVSGHNQPPDMAVTAAETTASLNDWLKEHPVIQDEGAAREAKVLIDRGKLCIKDLEDERDGKVRPLNEKVKEINGYYATPRNVLSKIIGEFSARLGQYLRQEEERRQRIAEEAARVAREAEDAARGAERRERDCIAGARQGVLDGDIAETTREADEAFKKFQQAAQQAALAQRETKVKIGGGFRKAASLREKEELILIDPVVAMMNVGPTSDIIDAIIKGARAYRRLWNKLPPGVEARKERGL